MFTYFLSTFYFLTLPFRRTSLHVFICTLLLSERQVGKAWEPSKMQCSVGNHGELDRKKIHFSCYSRFKNVKLGFPRQCHSDHLFIWYDAVQSGINFPTFLIFCFHREDGGSTFFQNICKFLSVYTASHARSHCHLRWRMSSEQCLLPVTLACDK